MGGFFFLVFTISHKDQKICCKCNKNTLKWGCAWDGPEQIEATAGQSLHDKTTASRPPCTPLSGGSGKRNGAGVRLKGDASKEGQKHQQRRMGENETVPRLRHKSGQVAGGERRVRQSAPRNGKRFRSLSRLKRGQKRSLCPSKAQGHFKATRVMARQAIPLFSPIRQAPKSGRKSTGARQGK